ncbi:MAG: response regulator [Candidatus Riflebacteria bacterium]|nr:response regulator [Candidatus Riflebacteria bacterium]
MKIVTLRKFFVDTLRGRLILGVAIVHALMMVLFMADLTSRQLSIFLESQEEMALGLSQSLATSATVWLAANDISGLQELVDIQSHHSELVFAIITNENGHIIAHSDKSRIGQYITDLPETIRQTVISRTSQLVDVITPSFLRGRLVGWSRVGISQKRATKRLSEIVINGIFYGILAILLGSFIAGFMGHRITQRLYYVQETVNKVKKGNCAARSQVVGNDEASTLAREFNEMLDTLSERDAELLKSETRLELALNAANEAWWEWDFVTGKTIFSSSYYSMLGYNSGDFPSNYEEWKKRVHPDEVNSIERFLIKQLAEKKSDYHNLEMRMLCKNGQWLWISGNGKIIERDCDGFPVKIIGTNLDISARKQMEKDKEQLQIQLNHSQKMEYIGRLAGGIAHDFNNMLGVIIGYSELAIPEVENNKTLLTSLQEILKAANTSSDLTRQLLAFARKQTIEPKVLNINEVVGKMLKMLHRVIGEDINLKWIPAENIWDIKIDPSQVDQILVNLCINARDAIAGVGEIIIETQNDTIPSPTHPEFCSTDTVLLSVTDNGCGMRKEILDRIFEPYFTTKEMGKGTGLGLATVYGIVKQNNGFINVYSEPEHGATFKIYFPRYFGPRISQDDQESQYSSQCGTETILLVEDEPKILEISTTILKNLNYQVLSSGNPLEALQIAERFREDIHLLLTDVIMPEMNGYELAKKISALHPETKCLYMSGYTKNVIAHHGILKEGLKFIPKPFSIKSIAFKIREVLEQ